MIVYKNIIIIPKGVHQLQKILFIQFIVFPDIASISIFNWDYCNNHWASEVILTSCEDDYLFYKMILISLPHILKFEGGRRVSITIELL